MFFQSKPLKIDWKFGQNPWKMYVRNFIIYYNLIASQVFLWEFARIFSSILGFIWDWKNNNFHKSFYNYGKIYETLYGCFWD